MPLLGQEKKEEWRRWCWWLGGVGAVVWRGVGSLWWNRLKAFHPRRFPPHATIDRSLTLSVFYVPRTAPFWPTSADSIARCTSLVPSTKALLVCHHLRLAPPFFCYRNPSTAIVLLHTSSCTHTTHTSTQLPPPASTRNLPPPSLHIMKLLPLCVTLAALMPVVSAVSPLKQRKQATAVKVRARQRRGRGGGGPRWREWMWTCVA